MFAIYTSVFGKALGSCKLETNYEKRLSKRSTIPIEYAWRFLPFEAPHLFIGDVTEMQ